MKNFLFLLVCICVASNAVNVFAAEPKTDAIVQNKMFREDLLVDFYGYVKNWVGKV